MIEHKPWLPDPERIVQALRAIVEHAEAAGMRCIPQWYTLQAVTTESGDEQGIAGLLRYTGEKVIEDWQSIDGAATISFVVRFVDPSDPDSAADWEAHQIAAAKERAGLEGKA